MVRCFYFFLIGIELHKKFYNKNKSTIVKLILFLSFIFSFIFFLYEKYKQVGTFKGNWIRLNNDYIRLPTILLSSYFSSFLFTIDFTNCDIFNKICSFISIRTMNIY